MSAYPPFHFHFPKKSGPAGDTPSVDTSANEHFEVLLVEDEDKFVTMIHDLVAIKEKNHWRLSHAETLAAAMERVKAAPFDVVIMNLYLPDSTGLSTLQKFVAQHPALPVVVVTGLTDERIAKDAIREGAQDYLVKGQFTSDYFIRAVQYAVERKKIDALRDELASYMNHEIASPLGVIKDSLMQLTNGELGPVNPEQEQFLKMSLSGIDRLVTITDDVALCTKLELGKLPVEKKEISLNETAREIATAFMPAFVHNKVGLKLRLPFRDVRIHADKERIGQILTNLLSNALKYTPDGEVRVRVARAGDHAELSVSDTGYGIAEENLPKLFQKYQQGFSGNGHPIRGTGLGLYICKILTELHGGLIRAESQVGIGTTFTVTLPAG